MDSLFSSRNSSIAELSSPLIHSPLPMKTKLISSNNSSAQKLSKAVMVNFNDDDDEEDCNFENFKPSRFFIEKLRQITAGSQDDIDEYTDTASNRSYSIDDSVDERRCIMESFDHSFFKHEPRPISRALNPHSMDRDFQRAHQPNQPSLFARNTKRFSVDFEKST